METLRPIKRKSEVSESGEVVMTKKEAAQILSELAEKKKSWTEYGQRYTQEVIEALAMGAAELEGVKMIKALVKLPKFPAHIEYVENTLEGLQKLVRGQIETVMFEPGWCVICDEEGRIKCRFRNCTINDIDFVGKIAFVGVEGEEFTDFELTEEFKEKYSFLFEE